LGLENDSLTLHFLLLLFDTPTWHVLFRMTMKEKMQFFFGIPPPETHVCVPKLQTANHLFQLS